MAWNPFSKYFSSGYAKGGVTQYSDPTAPTDAKFFYQREHGGGLPGQGTPTLYFENEEEMEAYFKVDQASYRTKWQLITITIALLVGGGLYWRFKHK